MSSSMTKLSARRPGVTKVEEFHRKEDQNAPRHRLSAQTSDPAPISVPPEGNPRALGRYLVRGWPSSPPSGAKSPSRPRETQLSILGRGGPTNSPGVTDPRAWEVPSGGRETAALNAVARQARRQRHRLRPVKSACRITSQIRLMGHKAEPVTHYAARHGKTG